MLQCYFESPIGGIIIEGEGDTVWSISYCDELQSTPEPTGEVERCKTQLLEYFSGTRKQFDIRFRWLPSASSFTLSVWQALLGIPFGQTATYGEIAARIGRPKACRAVGGANHHNCLNIIVPCHRVIGANGSLTGYGGGLDKKQWLLAHEKQYQKF